MSACFVSQVTGARRHAGAPHAPGSRPGWSISSTSSASAAAAGQHTAWSPRGGLPPGGAKTAQPCRAMLSTCASGATSMARATCRRRRRRPPWLPGPRRASASAGRCRLPLATRAAAWTRCLLTAFSLLANSSDPHNPRQKPDVSHMA